jgi:hypothetical protein
MFSFLLLETFKLCLSFIFVALEVLLNSCEFLILCSVLKILNELFHNESLVVFIKNRSRVHHGQAVIWSHARVVRNSCLYATSERTFCLSRHYCVDLVSGSINNSGCEIWFLTIILLLQSMKKHT